MLPPPCRSWCPTWALPSPELVQLLHGAGALPDTVERARHYGSMARDALAPMPESRFKDALLEAVAFCIGRAY